MHQGSKAVQVFFFLFPLEFPYRLSMDESRATKQKTDAEAKTDRISNLPDDLLCKILSYLPTKHAATTSILSKSWKSLWLSLPSLDLDDGIDVSSFRSKKDSVANYSRFAHFVDDVLIFRRHYAQQSIQRFRLKCSFCPNPSDITRWVHTAIQRNVEELDLDLSLCFSGGVSLPPEVFTCRTIKVLRLKRLIVSGIDSVRLPSLKILHLKYVSFPDLECVAKLLSSCAILEDLVLNSLTIFSNENGGLCESFLKLVRADIRTRIFIPLKAIPNVASLKISSMHSYYYARATTPTFYNLVTMEMTFLTFEWDLLFKMLYNSPKLQNLVVQERSIGEVKVWKKPRHVPGCLSFHLRTCCVRGFESGEKAASLVPFARYVMEKARVLQTMTVCWIDPSAWVMHWVAPELSSCPRRSPTCQFNLEVSTRFTK